MKQIETRNDVETMRDIIKRVRSDLHCLNHHDGISLMMDLESARRCGLDITRLLTTDDLTFAHDVLGIVRHMDRTAYPGTLKDCFVPRCQSH